ncbi:hypothetical protein [Streptomyces sp. NPDC102462]|uniref:hypothetical protein n=1 Tax=Streptomyces sp. NPDC102462 TaxID=3366178 RepID=UPI00380902EC
MTGPTRRSGPASRRPTPSERAAAREAARADKNAIIERYRAREPVSRIADAYGVTAGWLSLRLDEWGVPRRRYYEAHLHRRPARRLFGGRMRRRSGAEVRAAQAKFRESRTSVVMRYRGGESVASLARSFHVSHAWAAERLDEWGASRKARPATRVCARCLRETTEAVLVKWIDTGSGPGVEVWTCPEHVKGYNPEEKSPRR